jgi:hypothetical protein
MTKAINILAAFALLGPVVVVILDQAAKVAG